MKIFINGTITADKWEGCYSPKDLKETLDGIDENEPLEVEITSEGGDVFSGITIGNMLARWKGNVTTHAVGFVASIATVILMAGKKVVADSNAMTMFHLPWTMTQGNANDLQKEIDALDKCKHAMMSFYMRKAKVSSEEIDKMLDDETWLLGSELPTYFDVEVLECGEQMDIAAKFDLSKYKNIPERILNMKNEEIVNADAKPVVSNEEETTIEAESTAQAKTTSEEEEHIPLNEIDVETTQDIEALRALLYHAYEAIAKLEDENEEKTDENQSLFNKLQDARKENDELKEKLVDKIVEGDEISDKAETITKAECEKRVSGMQASMQKQINDFQSQLMAKNEELIKAQTEITSLKDSLEKSASELSAMASALDEKTQALDKLNANVNAHAEELPTYEEGLAKCASPAEKVAFIKSGKYRR